MKKTVKFDKLISIITVLAVAFAMIMAEPVALGAGGLAGETGQFGAEVVHAASQTGVVTPTDGLHMRKGAGTSYAIIITIPYKKTVTVLGSTKAKDGKKWYKVTYSGKTGYVISTYLKVTTSTTTTSGTDYTTKKYGYVKSAVVVRAKMSTSATSYGKISSRKIIRLRGLYKSSNGTKWYRIIYKSKSRYVLASRILRVGYTAYSTAKKGVIKDGPLNVRSGPGTSFAQVGSIAKGKIIKVNAKVKYNGIYWYKFTYNSKIAYVAKEYVTIKSSTGGTTPTTPSEPDEPDTVLTAKEFEKYMTEQGFPDSYKPYLRTLHKNHPKWVFKAQKTGLKWSTVINAENTLGYSLIEPDWPAAWKTLRKGAYNFSGNYYVSFDGRWNQASLGLIKYYVDPRNGLNSDNIFEFMTHKFSSKTQSTKTIKGITSSVSGCFLNPLEYRKALYNAGKDIGVNPNVLTAMVISEQGWYGTSGLVSGNYSTKVYDPIAGKTVSLKGYYNHFNIGAYSYGGRNAVQNGLLYAKHHGWNTPYKSLAGGAEIYANQYVKKCQYTYYTKKFNVAGGSVNTSHQYSTAVAHAVIEGNLLKKAYKNSDAALKFYIPVYKNMPAKRCCKPGTSGNNDYYLNSLKIVDRKISPSFDRYTKTYKATVPKSVTSIKVTAKAHSSSASVTGTGTHKLVKGLNKIKVKVKASSGAYRIYVLNVTRKSE